MGIGLNSSQVKAYIAKKKNFILTTKTSISKLESLLVKVETSNLLGEYISPEVYMGIKSNLSKQHSDLSLELEVAEGELANLNNKGDWLQWIDECAKVVASVTDTSTKTISVTNTNVSLGLSERKKKRFLHNVLDNIKVNFDHTEQLHHLRIRFRLPIMSDVKYIFESEPRGTNVLVKGTQPAENISQSGDQTTPVGDYSTVTLLAKFLG